MPRPALIGPSLLSHYEAPHFLHISGQTLFVCTATKQVKMTGDDFIVFPSKTLHLYIQYMSDGHMRFSSVNDL